MNLQITTNVGSRTPTNDDAMRRVVRTVDSGHVPMIKGIRDDGEQVVVTVHHRDDLTVWQTHAGAESSILCGTVGKDPTSGARTAETGFYAGWCGTTLLFVYAEELPTLAPCSRCGQPTESVRCVTCVPRVVAQ